MELLFAVSLPCVTRPVTRTGLTMVRRRSFKNQRGTGPSRTPREKKADMEKIAKEFGVLPTKPGQDLDKKYNKSKKAEETTTLYTALAGLAGTDALDTAEVGLLWILGGLLSGFIGLGLVISSAAFYKALEKPVPGVLESFLGTAEPLFTPTLVIFLAGSSIFGLYKQSQLNSGATGYEERDR